MTANIYLENNDYTSYSNVKKIVENDYLLSKADHPKTSVKVKSLLQNFQPTGVKQYQS